MKSSRRKDAGFSLVELAVVLVIIGILIAGVLKGQGLVQSARLKHVATQIQQYRLATMTFIDRYGFLPGDFPHASTYIDSGLVDGDGVGVLSGTGLHPHSSAFHFWSHLIFADLVSPPSTLDDVGTPTCGKGVPTTTLGGGVTVEYNPAPDLPGLWFIAGNAHGQTGKGALFTPKQALSILSKLDTAAPLSGAVQARDGIDGVGSNCINTNQRLDMSHDQVACVLYFKL